VDKAASFAENVDVEQEVSILRQIKHPNIVGMLAAHEGETKIFVVMELCVAPCFSRTPGE
jgi:serine/threonine protein kinase